MKKFIFILIFFIQQILYAGVYGDDFMRCMYQNTTKEDIRNLKKFIFLGWSHDEDLKKYISITKKEEDKILKKIVKYYSKILLHNCKKEHIKVLKYEKCPKCIISRAFENIGGLAAKSILATPYTNELAKKMMKLMEKELEKSSF